MTLGRCSTYCKHLINPNGDDCRPRWIFQNRGSIILATNRMEMLLGKVHQGAPFVEAGALATGAVPETSTFRAVSNSAGSLVWEM